MPAETCCFLITASLNTAHMLLLTRCNPSNWQRAAPIFSSLSSRMSHCLKMWPGKLLNSSVVPPPRTSQPKWSGEAESLRLLQHWKTAKYTLPSRYRSKSPWNISGTLLNQCLDKDSCYCAGQRAACTVMPRCVIKLSMSVFTILVKDYTSVRPKAEIYLPFLGFLAKTRWHPKFA